MLAMLFERTGKDEDVIQVDENEAVDSISQKRSFMRVWKTAGAL